MKKPRVCHREICEEISRRTMIAKELVSKIISTYEDVIGECQCAGVDAVFGKIGHFTFRYVPPKKNKIFYNPAKREYGEPTDVPGHYAPKFKFNPSYAKQIIEDSLEYLMDEEKGENK